MDEVPSIARPRLADADDLPEILTIEQAARYLQLHPQVVYRHVRAGTLPASRIGRTIRFKKSVLDAFLETSGWASVREFQEYKQRQSSGESRPFEVPERRRRRFSADVD